MAEGGEHAALLELEAAAHRDVQQLAATPLADKARSQRLSAGIQDKLARIRAITRDLELEVEELDGCGGVGQENPSRAKCTGGMATASLLPLHLQHHHPTAVVCLHRVQRRGARRPGGPAGRPQARVRRPAGSAQGCGAGAARRSPAQRPGRSRPRAATRVAGVQPSPCPTEQHAAQQASCCLVDLWVCWQVVRNATGC